MKLRSFFESKFELSGGNRIVPMEGMRGFAALLVFFVHFHALFGKYIADNWASNITRFMASIGHVGVDFFFVISGFLIYGIVMRRPFRFFPYLLRRIQRLYPVFIAVMAIYLILSFIFPEKSKLPADFISAVGYIMANLTMLPGMTQIIPIITVAWSLSYEWFFYLILPILIAGLRIRDWKSGWRIALFTLTAMTYWMVCISGHSRHPRLVLFVAGILIWEISRRRAIPPKLPKWGEPFAAFSFVAVLALLGLSILHAGPVELILSKAPRFYVPLLFISLFSLVSYGLFSKGILFSFFSWTPLRWVGNMSYSYYLTHGLTLHGLNLFLGIALAGRKLHPFMLGIMILVSMAATVISAGALYLAIEKPLSIDK